jgi:membrane fusion protein, multidrug efflux system
MGAEALVHRVLAFEEFEVPMNKTGTTLATGVLILALLGGCQSDADDKSAGNEEDSPAIPVEIALGSRGDIYAVYSGTAPIEAFADAQVVAKVGGEVREILVEEGDDVKSGQLLARLDGDRLRFEMQQAAANLSKLQRDYQRNIDLRDRSLISAGDFEKIQYEMEALQATHDLTRLELSYTEIRAPIEGVVSQRFIKVGNTIDVNAPTFQITSLEPLVSYLHVPEREYRRIAPGQTATLRVDALRGNEFSGTVARISPIVDPATGTFKATIEIYDESRRLKPGMFARIAIVYDMHADALQIPRSAIVEEAGKTAIFVINDDTAHRRAVTTGYTENGRIEIIEGLADEETFVVVGQAGLKEGTRVSVINAASIENTAAQTAQPLLNKGEESIQCVV